MHPSVKFPGESGASGPVATPLEPVVQLTCLKESKLQILLDAPLLRKPLALGGAKGWRMGAH